jgi:HNH endonuclease
MRSIYKTFKKQFYLAREIQREMDKTGRFTLKFRATQESSESSLETPDPELSMRFAMVMRRFLDPQDRIYYKSIWTILKEEFGDAIPPGLVAAIDNAIAQITKGLVAVEVNGEQITAERMYEIIADGERFNRLEEHVQFLKSLANIPMIGQLLWHQFYDYTEAVLEVASHIFHAISEAEKSDKFQRLYGPPTTPRCIYCLSTIGPFKSEEHIIPEALGAYDYVLPAGYVCDRCNNGELARLDEELVNSPLFAMRRIDSVMYDKRGRLPETRLGDFTVKRTDPLNVTWTADPGSDAVKIEEELPDGQVRFRVRTKFGLTDG